METLVIQYKNQSLVFEKDLRLDIEQIDEQHHTLFRLTHEVSRLLEGAPSQEEVEVRALEVEAYVQEHLAFEETLLSKNGYDDFSAHKRSHDDFSQTARALRDRISDPGTDYFQQVARELFDLLLNWLVDHIMAEDKAARDFMLPGEHDVKPRPPRINVIDDVVVAFSDAQKVSGLLKNVSPGSVLVSLTLPLPKWLCQGAQVKLHLLPLGGEGDVS
ncbi:MAG: hemerythrin family protein, partial [Magnetococcales bacterium]|nr:hemerythrin family protein [Magnetococcales bacterium]